MTPREYSLGFGPTGMIPKACANYCDGPENIGDSQESGEPFIFRWVFWQAADGLRAKRLTGAWSFSDVDGALTGLADGEQWPHVHSCFDPTGSPVHALEIGGYCEIRRYVSGVPTTFSFNGRSPLVVSLGNFEPSAALQEVVCLYLGNGDHELFGRFQRDNFAVEYSLGLFVQPVLRLVAVDKDAVTLLGTSRLVVTALADAARADGRAMVFWYSAAYPAWGALDVGRAVASITPLSGEYTSVTGAVSADDEGMVSIAPLSGLYDEVIVTTSPAEEGVGIIAPLAGVYNQVVQSDTSTRSVLTSIAPLSGAYTQTVQTAPVDEAGTGNIAPLSGAYTAA